MWTTPTRCPQSHEAEQNQKKRTYEVLPKPDNLTRYRQHLSSNLGLLRKPRLRPSATCARSEHVGARPTALILKGQARSWGWRNPRRKRGVRRRRPATPVGPRPPL